MSSTVKNVPGSILILMLTASQAVYAKDAAPTAAVQAIIRTIGVTEGSYQPKIRNSEHCPELELNFVYPDNASLSILDGARALFETVGRNTRADERGCARRVQSSVATGKILQTITIRCGAETISHTTEGHFSTNGLTLRQSTSNNQRLVESSFCSYRSAR